jgi:hypothetical protein
MKSKTASRCSRRRPTTLQAGVCLTRRRLPGGAGAAGMAARALGEERVVAGQEVVDHGAGQGRISGGTGVLRGDVVLAQECDQTLRPGVPGVSLGDGDQLTQMVGVTEPLAVSISL